MTDRRGVTKSIARRLAAESLGTAVLVAAVIGSGIMADGLTGDGALALLCNTLATGAILVVLIGTLGPISGAHFNPAVSLVMAIRGDLRWPELPPYLLAQVAGAIAGAWLAHAMFDLPILQVSTTIRTGTSQWLSETVAAFGLVTVILAGLRLRAEAIPWLVGLYITAAYWFTASTSFANPAVTIARTLTDSFSGIRPLDALPFILAQIVGALLALGLANWLFSLQPTRTS